MSISFIYPFKHSNQIKILLNIRVLQGYNPTQTSKKTGLHCKTRTILHRVRARLSTIKLTSTNETIWENDYQIMIIITINTTLAACSNRAHHTIDHNFLPTLLRRHNSGVVWCVYSCWFLPTLSVHKTLVSTARINLTPLICAAIAAAAAGFGIGWHRK